MVYSEQSLLSPIDVAMNFLHNNTGLYSNSANLASFPIINTLWNVGCEPVSLTSPSSHLFARQLVTMYTPFLEGMHLLTLKKSLS